MLDDISGLVEAGFSVIWLKKREKMPVESKWTAKPTYSLSELRNTYEKGFNSGVRLGKPSIVRGKYLHCLDMDIRDEKETERAKKQVKLLLELDLEDYPTVLSGSGGPSRHFYFLADEPFGSKKLWTSGEKIVGDDGKDHWTAEIELFGTGKQTVLPPSIHPDSGLEYEWATEFDVRDLPVMDLDLLKAVTGEGDYVEDGNFDPLGLRLEEAEAALAHIEHWADDHETWRNVGMALKHEFGPEGWPIFDAWSRKGKGYDKGDNRAQWRAFKNSRAKPLTMRTIMQASNEAMRAIDEEDLREEFKKLVDEPREPKHLGKAALIRMFEEDAGKLEKRETRDGEVRGVPRHLLTVPGRLGAAVKHYNATSIKLQPQFAVQTALALGSVVLARYWKTSFENYTTLYFVNLGGTGEGKEFCRTFLMKTLKAAKFERLVGPSQYTSEAAITGELIAFPRHVAIIDELGKILGSQKGGQSPNAMEAQAALMSMFGLVGGAFRPKSYSMNGKSNKQIAEEKNRLIERPALSLIGLSTPETFYDALGQEDIASGFMNRLLVVNSRMPDQLKQLNPWSDPPKELIRWIRDHVLPEELESFLLSEFDRDAEAGNPYGEEIERPPEASIVEFSKGALRRLREIEIVIRDERQHLKPMRLDGLFARAHEITMRIALIVALSMDRRNPIIEEADVDWAWDYVKFYTMETIEHAKLMLGATPVVRTAAHLAEVIDENGKRGLTVRDMARASSQFRTMTSRDKEEVTRQLLTSHNIEEIEVKGAYRGARPTKRFVTKEIAEELLSRSARRRDDEDLS